MLELLGIIGGALTPFIKEAFGIWRMKVDYAQEQEMFALQLKRMDKEHQYKVREAELRADITESGNIYNLQTVPIKEGFMEGLRASVRPVVTYGFMLFYFAVKIATFHIISENPGALPWREMDALEALVALWTPEERVIFSTIIGFWFGGRMLEKGAKVQQLLGNVPRQAGDGN
jgi:hypothetical protein